MDSKSNFVSYNFNYQGDGIYNVSLDKNKFAFWMLKNSDQVKEGEPRLNCVEIHLSDEKDREGMRTFFQQGIEFLNQNEK